MSWRDELLPASFREIPFYIDTTSLAFGRRVQLNEYPFSDTPNTLNVGRKARQYTINAYVIGDEYLLARNALLAAVEDLNTPGLLTLPTLAPVLVYPTEQCRLDFNNTEGGIEKFTFVFVEAGKNLFPSLGDDTQFQAAIEAAEAAAAIYEDFESRYKTGDFPGFVGGDAKGKIEDFVGLLGTAAQTGVSSQTQFANFSDSISKFSESINTDYTKPDKIGGGIRDNIAALSDIYDSPNDAFNAQLKLTQYGTTYPAINAITATTQQQKENQNALINIVQNLAIVQLALTTSKMVFASRQDAIAVRDQVSALINQQLFTLSEQGNDAQFNALTDVLAAMVNDITARSATLKNIVFVKTIDTQPAGVFAYNNYGSVDSEDDVVARNNIRHPLFISPLSTLEVLK